MRESGESKSMEVELFLNSVPLLAGLSGEEKQRLVDAFDEQTFAKGERVINEVSTPVLRPVGGYYWEKGGMNSEKLVTLPVGIHSSIRFICSTCTLHSLQSVAWM